MMLKDIKNTTKSTVILKRAKKLRKDTVNLKNTKVVLGNTVNPTKVRKPIKKLPIGTLTSFVNTMAKH